MVIMCGKIIYPNQAAAINSIRGIKKDKRPFRSKKKPVHTYYCNDCGGFHLTSNKRRLRVLIKTTKEIFTNTRESVGRLLIIDFTSFKNNMGRSLVLLCSLLIMASATSGFSDSRIKKTSTAQVEVVQDVGYDFDVKAYASVKADAELGIELIFHTPKLGLTKPVTCLVKAKACKGFVQAYRGPPDSRSKN